jgi:hypothetical protein
MREVGSSHLILPETRTDYFSAGLRQSENRICQRFSQLLNWQHLTATTLSPATHTHGKSANKTPSRKALPAKGLAQKRT